MRFIVIWPYKNQFVLNRYTFHFKENPIDVIKALVFWKDIITHKQHSTVAKCCSRTQSRRNTHILFYFFSALHTQDHCMLIIIISSNKGGAYIISELAGSVFDWPIAAFCYDFKLYQAKACTRVRYWAIAIVNSHEFKF